MRTHPQFIQHSYARDLSSIPATTTGVHHLKTTYSPVVSLANLGQLEKQGTGNEMETANGNRKWEQKQEMETETENCTKSCMCID